MNAIRKLLGLDGDEDRLQKETHRKELKEALKKQSEASTKAESNLVDLLAKASRINSEKEG